MHIYNWFIIILMLFVATSEREGKLSNPGGRAARAQCVEKSYGNLRKPVRVRRVRAMHLFLHSQEHSNSRSKPGNAHGSAWAMALTWVLSCT
jgi:hypothetical protein